MLSAFSRVEKLEPAECMTLLSSVRLGRLGWSGPEGPQVLPVNHTVLDGQVVFRTNLYSALADGTRGAVVALEADELDDRMQSGWSVLVVGPSEHVEDRDEMRDLFERMREPWAAGDRTLIARISPERMTGRRFFKES